MVVDYERAWLALKSVVVAKPSHGKRELLTAMAEIEVESRVPEGREGYDPAPLRPQNGRRSTATLGSPGGDS